MNVRSRVELSHAERTELRALLSRGKQAVAAEPREGSFDHRSAGQDEEAFDVVRALDDFEPEPRRSGDGVFDLVGVVAGIGPDEFEPWKALAGVVAHCVFFTPARCSPFSDCYR